MRGVVDWFNGEKGYGFIKSETNDAIFVHFSEILGEGFKTLMDDQNVEFDITIGSRGPMAVNVRVIEKVERNMSLLEYIKEQIANLEKDARIAEEEKEDLKRRLDVSQRQFEVVLDRLDDFKKMLKLAQEDYKKYGDYNPAG